MTKRAAWLLGMALALGACQFDPAYNPEMKEHYGWFKDYYKGTPARESKEWKDMYDVHNKTEKSNTCGFWGDCPKESNTFWGAGATPATEGNNSLGW